MDRCPLCRAALNGSDTCRRCRAELRSAQQVEAEARELLGAAILCLVRDDPEGAAELLRQALALHATPPARALWQVITRVGNYSYNVTNGAHVSTAAKALVGAAAPPRASPTSSAATAGPCRP